MQATDNGVRADDFIRRKTRLTESHWRGYAPVKPAWKGIKMKRVVWLAVFFVTGMAQDLFAAENHLDAQQQLAGSAVRAIVRSLPHQTDL